MQTQVRMDNGKQRTICPKRMAARAVVHFECAPCIFCVYIIRAMLPQRWDGWQQRCMAIEYEKISLKRIQARRTPPNEEDLRNNAECWTDLRKDRRM